MDWLLSKLSLRHKLAALTLVPLVAMIWFQLDVTLDRQQERNFVAELRELVEVSVKAGDLVHDLQRERGITAIYLSSEGKKLATAMSEQRDATDLRIIEFVAIAGKHSPDAPPDVRAAINSATELLNEIAAERDRISNNSITTTEAIAFYTETNAGLINIFSSLQLAVDDTHLDRQLVSYSALVNGKETAGLERALLGVVFDHNEITPEQHATVAGLISRRDTYLDVFAQTTSSEMLELFEVLQAEPIVAEVNAIEARVLSRENFEIDSSLWFDTMSERIDLLKNLEDAQSDELVTRSTELTKNADSAFLHASILVLIVLAFTLSLVGAIARRIANQLESLSEQAELIAGGNLLVEDLSLNGRDTVAKLGGSFDRMAHTLHLIRDQIKAISTSDLQAEALTEAIPGELGAAIENLVSNSQEHSGLLTRATFQSKELEASSKELGLAKNRFETLLQNAFEAILLLDESDTITYISSPFEQITDIPADSFIGTNFDTFQQFVHADDKTSTQEIYRRVAQTSGSSATSEFRFMHPDGSWHWIDLYVRNLLDDESVRGIVINARDITEKKNTAIQLEQHAYHDSLTGLPNRRLLEDRLEHALAQTSRHGGTLALLFLDLDKFKEVNDTMGHSAGDELLLSIAERISTLIRSSDTAARFGGDEFVILAEGLNAASEAQILGERLLASISEPIQVQNQNISITASAGIVVAIDGDIDSSTMIRNADAAMYKAKQSAEKQLEFYGQPG